MIEWFVENIIWKYQCYIGIHYYDKLSYGIKPIKYKGCRLCGKVKEITRKKCSYFKPGRSRTQELHDYEKYNKEIK